MELKLYDTLTREKRAFAPLDPARVRMYVCGPTVYDFAHIGNARPVIVFDVLFRLLRHLHGADHVVYVRNITDVDDKINARAAERGIDIRALTEETYKNFKEDVAALGCLPPTIEPRATEHIEEMKALIEKLVKSEHAYVAEDHALFSVPSMNDYGQLSKRPLDEMIAGARVEVAPYKRDPMDFVLWKPSKESEPSWPSPSGIKAPGRPGWHIECSAMAWKHLGETFDIHGGGIDLVFPHHENEIAQTRCAFHSGVMANYWMHNGFLQVEGEKMAKSAGNFVTIQELLKGDGRRRYAGELIRLTMLATHYRQPIDFNEAKLRYWWNRLSHWVSRYSLYGTQEFDSALRAGKAEIFPSKEIVEALSDDLNFSQCIAYLEQLAALATKHDSAAADELGRNLVWLGLMRRTHLGAYDDRALGNARPDLLKKYEGQIDSARAVILNSYKFSTDAGQRKINLAEIDRQINQLDSRMDSDGVRLDVSEDLNVSLEPVSAAAAIDSQKVDKLIADRNAARKAKNFKEADRIRDELAAMGVVLKDSKDGTTWEIAR